MAFQLPKGTFDIVPSNHLFPNPKQSIYSSACWQWVEKILKEVADNYGCLEIRTPAFEYADLFTSSAGRTSELVHKQLYTFKDKADRLLALRPEGTAPLVRSLIAHRVDKAKGRGRFFYMGAMFRYERPQAGRFRQFHQFGVEMTGVRSPYHDAEMIDMAIQIHKRLGINHYKLLLNNIGDLDARSKYVDALRHYFSSCSQQLSAESQSKIVRNPLRILDSKDQEDQQVIAKAPKIASFISAASSKYFEELQRCLRNIEIDFEIDDHLVRGLDYYKDTVFEIHVSGLGAKSATGGGGRYDQLIADMGGEQVSATGFALGMERLLQIIEHQSTVVPPANSYKALFIPLSDISFTHCFRWLTQLRHLKVSTDIEYPPFDEESSWRKARELQVIYGVLIDRKGELSRQAKFKNMATGKIESVDFSSVIERLEVLDG